MADRLENVNPRTYEVVALRTIGKTDYDDDVVDPFDNRERRLDICSNCFFFLHKSLEATQ